MKRRNGFQPRVLISLLMFFLQVVLVVTFFVVLVLSPFGTEFYLGGLIVLLLFDCVIGLFIANTKVEASFKISWLVVVICLPFVGGFLYLLFANKITTKKMRKNRFAVINDLSVKLRPDSSKELAALSKKSESAGNIANYLYLNANSGTYTNTEVTYYKIGDLSLEPMVQELKKAKKFIFLEYFIMQSGEFFDSLFNVLVEKVNEGVDVRLIYDDFGCSSKMSSFFYKEVRKAGIKCYAFNMIRPFLDIRQNNRDHRKIMVIDGVVGFTGGINIADEYINIDSKFGLWKDNCVMLKGPAVNSLTTLFLSIWNLIEKKKKNEDTIIDIENFSYSRNKEYDVRENKKQNGFVTPFGEEPFDGEESARNVLLQMITKATKYVYISTPYLILDEEMITALEIAAKSGVDVRIITPGTPDKKIVYQCTRSFYGSLLVSGVKVYEYKPGFNHEKMMVVDGVMAETGTINLDFRSLYLHYENGIFFYGGKEVKDMDDDLKEMIKDSKEIFLNDYLKVSKIKRIWWSILRIFSTLF